MPRLPALPVRATAMLLALLAAQRIAAADGPPLLERIADEARTPVWAPTGQMLAWIREPVRAMDREGRIGPGMGGSPPVAAGGVGIRDLPAGRTRTVELIRDAAPLLGLAWTADATAVLAWDELRVWRLPAAADPLAATELLRVADGRRIRSLLPTPAGDCLLVVCEITGAADKRPGSEILACTTDGRRLSTTSGRQPLWLPDGSAFLASCADRLCRIDPATGAAVDLFSAGYYLTHPFPKPAAPPEGWSHEVWPVAVLRDGWLAVDVLEVGLRPVVIGGQVPFHGERLLWKPAATTINDRLTDAFIAFSEIGRRGERSEIAMLPLDDAGRFLRLETASDPDERLGRVRHSSRLQRTLAMSVDARAGVVLAFLDLPPSCRVERDLRGDNGTPGRDTWPAPVSYRLGGLSADRTQALFTFDGWAGDERRTGHGLLWLEPASGRRQWLELPMADVPRRLSIHAVPSPDGSRAALVAAGIAGTAGRTLWLARPDPAQTRPPMDTPYQAPARTATSAAGTRSAVVQPVDAVPAVPAVPAKQDF